MMASSTYARYYLPITSSVSQVEFNQDLYVCSYVFLLIFYHKNIYIQIATYKETTIPQGSITILCLHPCGHLDKQHLTGTFPFIGHMIYVT